MTGEPNPAASKRIVFVTQEYDPDGAILGISSDLVGALASRYAGVDVIALRAPTSAPRMPNVKVTTLVTPRRQHRLVKAAAYWGALLRALPNASAVLVHMSPIFAILGYPLARATGRPLLLWYSHGHASTQLRIAARLATHLLTATRSGFPLSGERIERKISVLGAGIETDRFTPGPPEEVVPGRLLSVGRISASKKLDLLLDALALVRGRDWHLRLIGGPVFDADRAYEAGLRERVLGLRLSDRVEFVGMVPYAQTVAEFQATWALAHTGATGGLDKVVAEAMSCGVPPVTTSRQAQEALGPLAATLAADPDPARLAAQIEAILDWTTDHRSRLGAELRAHAVAHHSLRHWADGVVANVSAGAG